MNTPFTLKLKVVESNYDNSVPILGLNYYSVRVTLRHKLHDVIQLIWYNSDRFLLKPVFFKITDSEGNSLPDSTFCEILDTEEPPTTSFEEFQLRIDYTLFNNPNIPNRDPLEELFDIAIEWNDTRGRTNTIKIRESLNCTIGTLKAYVADERNKSLTEGDIVDGSYFNLRYWADDDVCDDDSMKISEIVQLDVTPLAPVLFELLYNLEVIERSIPIVAEMDQPSSVRFFIKIASDVSNLQEEASLFEVNQRTSLRDFINVIIERADAYQVRRTFFNQVKLYHNETMIAIEENYNSCLYDVLQLDAPTLEQHRNVVTLRLLIHEHLSGVEGGILSRQFLNDLTSHSRFEFLPTTNDDLNNVHATSGSSNSNDLHHDDMLAFEPTRIVLQNGTEWNLSGDSYELLETNSMSIGPSQPTRRALVNQSDIGSMVYVFNFQVDDEQVPVEIVLNTSQCFIVDNGLHQPYVALSPSGASKLERILSRVAGRTVFQQVRIQVYDDPALSVNRIPTAQPTPTPTREPERNGQNGQGPRQNEGQRNPNVIPMNGGNRVRLLPMILGALRIFGAQDRHTFYLILKLGVFLFALNLFGVVAVLWKTILIIFASTVSIYSIVFRSKRVSEILRNRFLTERFIQVFGGQYQLILERTCARLDRFDDQRNRFMIATEVLLVKYAVIRTRKYQQEIAKINNEDGIVYRLHQTLSICAKDIVLFSITFVPSVLPLIKSELEQFRSSEVKDLRGDILKLYDRYEKRVGEMAEAEPFDIDAIVNYQPATNNIESQVNPNQHQDLDQEHRPTMEQPIQQDSGSIDEYAINNEEYEYLLEQYVKLQVLYNSHT